MAYGNRTPIREDLLSRSLPFIEKHKGQLTIVEYDIQMQSFPKGNPPQLANCWCIVVVSLGALIGRDNWLSYTWTFSDEPRPPDDNVLENGVRQACQRLRTMQVRQLQERNPGNPMAN